MASAEDDRVRHGAQLGRFLRALHAIDPDTVMVDGRPLTVDPVRRADMPLRAARLAEEVDRLAQLDLWRPPPGLSAVIDEAVALPPPLRLRLTHGDLHLRQVLVDGRDDLSGVIDWIDVCRADPAIDLALY